MTIEEMKERKRELGYSCEELARISGVPYATVQKIFSGFTMSPRRKTILALEAVLDKAKEKSCDDYLDIPAGNDSLSVREEVKEYDVRGSSTKDKVSYGDKKQGEFTLEDYYALPDDKRFELIDGVLYEMLAPTVKHQEVLTFICVELYSYVKKKKAKCKVLPAPTDIRLDMDDKTMVEPDILVLCNKNQITERYIEGAPDMVVEILSPSTALKDSIIKLRKYEETGVREYWIVDPKTEKVVVYYFEGNEAGHTVPTIYGFDAEVPVNIWKGDCKVDFRELKLTF